MLLELHQSYGYTPRKHTVNEWCSPCPGCGGDDRFIIFAEEEKYWCRQCGANGDAIQYLRDFQKMSFPAAALVGKSLSSDRGKFRTSSTAAPSAPSPKKASEKRERPAEWLAKVARFIEVTHNKLLANTEALEWLRLERGITQATAERFRLGWLAAEAWRKKSDWGLLDNGKKLYFPTGLVIPWQGRRARIRRENPGEFGRYYLLPGSDRDPMVIGTAHERTAIIVESDLDAILLSQEIKRDLFIVATGSTSYRPDEALLNDLLSCPVVLVALDSDKAGGKEALWWRENVPSTFRTLTPTAYGDDITAAFLNGLDLNEWLGVSMELYLESITGEQSNSQINLRGNNQHGKTKPF